MSAADPIYVATEQRFAEREAMNANLAQAMVRGSVVRASGQAVVLVLPCAPLLSLPGLRALSCPVLRFSVVLVLNFLLGEQRALDIRALLLVSLLLPLPSLPLIEPRSPISVAVCVCSCA